MIRPLPTKQDIRNWVEEVITPERAQTEAKRLIDIINAVSDADGDWRTFELAETAAHHAFTLTMDFEEAYREFAGLPGEKSTAEMNEISELSGKIN